MNYSKKLSVTWRVFLRKNVIFLVLHLMELLQKLIAAREKEQHQDLMEDKKLKIWQLLQEEFRDLRA